jgi:serine protein kinase
LRSIRTVNALKSAAQGYGIEKRVLLLHGPVGSSKSTIARLLKKGLERYSPPTKARSTRSAGSIPIGRRALVPDERGAAAPDSRAVPRRMCLARAQRRPGDDDYQVRSSATRCPFCRFMYSERLKSTTATGRRSSRMSASKRIILSEQDRIGIGTFQPKDEKNQDSTELTGDINYRKIAEYGSDSDPRAFNFDGEFNVANRGMIEFIEVLKLDVAFLYDLLGASQEHKVKPKKFAQTDIDEVIIGHTNEPEYRRLQNNEFMEALRDRTVKIDSVRHAAGRRDQDLRKGLQPREGPKGQAHRPAHDRNGRHVGVLTRLEEPKNAGLTLLQKLKLYNGKTLPGFTEENIKELREEATNEGCSASRPATCRTRSPTPWSRIPRPQSSTRSWC